MHVRILTAVCTLTAAAAAVAAPDAAKGPGPVAHWTFDEGTGDVLTDRSGNGNHGRVHGASWVKSGAGWALRFDGANDYVDCGSDASLDLTGPVTLQAWVMPTAANRGEPGIAGKFFESYALTYYGNAYFYISSGGNNVSGPTKLGEWRHVAGTFDGTTMRCFVNGVEVASRRSRFEEVKHGGRFTIGCIFGDPAAADPNLQNTAFFPGLIDDVRLHNRALTAAEIAVCYNDEAAGKGCEPFDSSRFGRLLLEPFYYPEAEQVVASVDFRWVLPLPENARAIAELARPGVVQPLQTRRLNPHAPRGEDEATFTLAGLPPGTYELRALLREADHVIQAEEPARKSDRVVAYAEGWQEGTVNLYGGWAEYDFEVPEGEYEIAVRAARIYDAAGIRCTIDGEAVGDLSLNGSDGGSPAAWEKATWEAVGFASLATGTHKLKVETIPVTVPGKEGPFGTHVYLDGIALSKAGAGAGGGETVEKVVFSYPFPSPGPPPASTLVHASHLRPGVVPPEYDVDLRADGGLDVHTGGTSFRVESRYSYPDGGYNSLGVPGPDAGGEPGWRVRVGARSGRSLELEAEGGFYTIGRRIDLQPSRILVRDTIRNVWDNVLGVIVSNRINLGAGEGVTVTQMANPTIFAARDGAGLGLIALDDLYQLRQRTAYSDGIAEIRDDHFGLARGAEHTIEWAIYPTATTDYYDFINQVRTDEGLNGHVAGAFSFVDRRSPPTPEFVSTRGLAYSSIGCLGKPLDNPATPLEGIEFIEYPKECAALADTFTRTKTQFPGMKVMFHVAHGLYICDNPEQRFPDSRALDANGRQMHYGPDSFDYYGKYISREMFDAGWRWWIFYPTPENSFGKAMISAMETMVRDMGATGMWADGYISGYVKGGYSYDRWDGNSVTIDPQSKRVTRKKTCAAYAALPVLKACARIISDGGGVLVSNGHPGPRSYWKEHTITSCETGGGDARPVGALHLGRTVTPLGNPHAIRNERDCYRDMLTKLDFGALFFWYGWGGELTHKTLTEHMYPITFDSIHAGTVRGRERIITKKQGVYGWPGERDLHAVYLYDARGALTRRGGVSPLTTVDGSGVRTEIALGRDESAAIVRIPVVLRSVTTLNLRVDEYGERGIRIVLHGEGGIELSVSDGEYAVAQSSRHDVRFGESRSTVAAAHGRITFPLALHGPMELTIRPSVGP